jgi:hypothetical protein
VTVPEKGGTVAAQEIDVTFALRVPNDGPSPGDDL